MMRALLWVATAIALAPPGFGQPSPPKFAVASIKASQPGRPFDVIQILPGGTFKATHVTVHTMIRMAYGLFSYQVKGGPSWLESDTYDIVAKPDGDANRDQVKTMVQALLIDRFRLSFHRDSTEVGGYAIVVGKRGPKLHTSDADSKPRKEIGRAFVNGQKITIDSLATSLAQILRCPVSDQTGLNGSFDFKLEWTTEQQPRPADVADRSTSTAGPPLTVFTAIEEQLGLKLEARKVPTETLVIDHIDKPSEN